MKRINTISDTTFCCQGEKVIFIKQSTTLFDALWLLVGILPLVRILLYILFRFILRILSTRSIARVIHALPLSAWYVSWYSPHCSSVYMTTMYDKSSMLEKNF